MKFDPHRSEACYKRWRKDNGGQLEYLTEKNTTLIVHYLDDMEVGANICPGSSKGPRSYIRLRNMKTKLHSWAIILQDELKIDYLGDMEDKERELMILVKRMRDGEICGRSKAHIPITAAGAYVKALKAFWHWYARAERRKGRQVVDITLDLDGLDAKPKFNYFTIEDLNKLCNEASYDYRVLMMFLFDSGIRAPTELMNVKVGDLEWNDKNQHYTLNIREETSKTFGRRIKLLLCSDILRAYLVSKKLKPEDYIFTKKPAHVNQYLKSLAHKVLSMGTDRGKTKMKNGYYCIIENGLTMYDFRHASACYWLVRYKSESALKYRFGWKKSDMIHYYTELLGMKDTIEEEDLYVDVSKTDLQRQLEDKGKEIVLLQEQIKTHEKKMDEVFALINSMKLEQLADRQMMLVVGDSAK